jgi:hypothetical protein
MKVVYDDDNRLDESWQRSRVRVESLGAANEMEDDIHARCNEISLRVVMTNRRLFLSLEMWPAHYFQLITQRLCLLDTFFAETLAQSTS